MKPRIFLEIWESQLVAKQLISNMFSAFLEVFLMVEARIFLEIWESRLVTQKLISNIVTIAYFLLFESLQDVVEKGTGGLEKGCSIFWGGHFTI